MLAKNLGDQLQLQFHTTGRGFTWSSDDITEDGALAKAAWKLAKTILAGGETRLIILDELTYPIKYGMIAEEEVMETLAHRPPGIHVVVTGRYASEVLLAGADLVTEMKEIKHPYRQGVKAQAGLDF